MVTEQAANSPDSLFLRKAHADLEAYLEKLDRSRLLPLFLFISLALFVVLIIPGGIYLNLDSRGLGHQLFEPARTAGSDWSIYIDWYGASRFIGVFWFIIAYWTLWLAIGLMWRDFGVYAALKSERREGSLLVFFDRYAAEVEAEVKSGRIRQMTGFRPSRIVGRTVLRQALILFPVCLIVSAVFAGFWYLDRMDYRLLDEEGIEYTDYWTSEVHRIDYDSVTAVNVTCRGKNKDKLILRYEIEIADGRSARVTSFTYPRDFRERLAVHLPDWRRADAKIRAGGARFVYPVFNSIVITDRKEFNPAECISGLDTLVGPALRRQVMALLAKPQTPDGKAVQ